MLRALEALKPRRSGRVYSSREWSAHTLALSPIERDVLAFYAAANHIPPVMRDCGLTSGDSVYKECALLSPAIGVSEDELMEACRETGPLRKSGLLQPAESGYDRMTYLVLADHVRDAFHRSLRSADELPGGSSSAQCAHHLDTTDFPHLDADVLLLTRYLEKVLSTSKPCASILLHGEPGTGKSELARVIAKALGAVLYEVPHVEQREQGRGRAMSGQDRMHAYRTIQKVIERTPRALILFDEIEDAFPTHAGPFGRLAPESPFAKAFINATLENATVPTFWISNTIDHIDPAVLRRFDYVLELRTPPRAVRARIVAKHFDGIQAMPEHLDRIASDDKLTPANIERVARVAKVVGGDSVAETAQLIDRLLLRSATPQRPDTGSTTVLPYDVSSLSASVSLTALANGLRSHPVTAVLFHGASGTGKTAFAHHLAKQLDRPFMRRTASDVLSKWVGEAERNIVEMFASAEQERALLFLDEADSILAGRRSDGARWETSVVNEFLARMEQFNGTLICATNMFDQLDAAAMRRFAVKVKLGELSTEAAWRMLGDALVALGITVPPPRALRSRLEKIAGVTPGDFATTVQQARVLGQEVTAEWVIARMEDESRLKGGTRVRAGFA
ncbi:MAG: AAA family ATPase [Sandaracinaceae bacterium]|nr:AAA family ATPase [Sandaracinaceae bacterium]